MNEIKLTGQVKAIRIKEHDRFMSCGMKLQTTSGLELWVQVKSVQKAGKELEWLPKLEDNGSYVLLAARATSYMKEELPVYEVSVSKGDIVRISKELAVQLEESGLSGSVLLKGQVKQAKLRSDGVPFLQLGLRYFKPKTNESDYYYVRVACPKDLDITQYGPGTYVLVLGKLTIGPDKRPTVEASVVS